MKSWLFFAGMQTALAMQATPWAGERDTWRAVIGHSLIALVFWRLAVRSEKQGRKAAEKEVQGKVGTPYSGNFDTPR